MKVSLLVLVGVIAISQISQTDAFLGLGLGLGLLNPFMPFGFGFGLGGLGWGGLGFRRFGLGFGRGFGRFGRDVESVEQKNIECTYNSENNKIRCEGQEEINCSVKPVFAEERFAEMRFKDLVVFPRDVKHDHIYDLFSFVNKKETEGQRFTFEDKKSEEPVTFSLWHKIGRGQNGFRFVAKKCWERFDKMVEETNGAVRVQLNIE